MYKFTNLNDRKHLISLLIYFNAGVNINCDYYKKQIKLSGIFLS